MKLTPFCTIDIGVRWWSFAAMDCTSALPATVSHKSALEDALLRLANFDGSERCDLKSGSYQLKLFATLLYIPFDGATKI